MYFAVALHQTGLLNGELVYGLAENTDVGFIVNQRLIRVCFGENDLTLRFEESEPVTILVTSSVGCFSSLEVCRRAVEFREAASFLLPPLGKLDVYDDSTQFESYTITYSDKVIVV